MHKCRWTFWLFGIAWLVATGLASAENLPLPVKLSLVPGVATSSDTEAVEGLDLGFLAVHTKSVQGFQIAPFYAGLNEASSGGQAALVACSGDFEGEKGGLVSITGNMKGTHVGLVCVAQDVIGYQHSLISITHSIHGVQTGFVNVSREVRGFQFGVLNYTDAMRGLQIGLFNIITQSSLPFMVGANARF
jgi:hypothetical protein